MTERFQGLWHHPVVGGNDQNHNVSDICAARAHCAESGMAGGIQKRNLLQLTFSFRMRKRNRIGANVLRDPARFTGSHIRFADDVQQSRLPMIDMAHDRDHGGAGAHVFGLVFLVELNFADRRMDNSRPLLTLFNFEPKPIFRAKFLSDRFVDGLVHVGHDLQLDQIGDQLERWPLQLCGKIANDDGRLQRDDLRVLGQNDLRFSGCCRCLLLTRRRPTGRSSRSWGGTCRGTSRGPEIRPTSLQIRPSAKRWSLRQFGRRLLRSFRRRFRRKLDESNLLPDLRRWRNCRSRRCYWRSLRLDLLLNRRRCHNSGRLSDGCNYFRFSNDRGHFRFDFRTRRRFRWLNNDNRLGGGSGRRWRRAGCG